MKALLKNNLVTSIAIGASYIFLWIIIEVFTVNLSKENFQKVIGYIVWTNCYLLILNLAIFHGIAFLLKKNRWLYTLLSIFLLCFLLSYGFYYWDLIGSHLFESFLRPQKTGINALYLTRSILYQSIGIIYFSVIKLSIRNVQLRHKNQQLLLEKKNAELEFLKSQTNPHFLFNTLNNIYALARKKSQQTAVSILRLSDILRYMLYSTNLKEIPIEEEVSIIEQYLELERIRYDSNLIIHFKKILDNAQEKIPPLLLLPLVENAFKHGISETIESPLIKIELILEKHHFHFRIENSMSFKEETDEPSLQIGLKNIKRQLELLFSDYSFTTTKKETIFIAELHINLISYAKT